MDADEDLIQSGYNPVYRVPLYQTVFHDSIVTTDRWELSVVKLKNLVTTRTLISLLYGVPSLWNIDSKALKTHGEKLKKLYAFFSPIHLKVGTLPMSRFEWLTSDKLVQRSRFGDVLSMTANFGKKEFEGVLPKCVEASWIEEERKESLCP